MKPKSRTDEWSRKQKNCNEDSYCTSKTTFSSVDERVFMVLKYTETSNVLETIRRFQRQFPNQRTPCRQTIQTIMDNYHKFVQYGLSLNKNLGNCGRYCSETAFETLWLFPEHYRIILWKPFSHPFIYWKLWSVMWSGPAIFVQFFCILLHSSVLVLGFTYRKALEHYRILDYVTRGIIRFV